MTPAHRPGEGPGQIRTVGHVTPHARSPVSPQRLPRHQTKDAAIAPQVTRFGTTPFASRIRSGEAQYQRGYSRAGADSRATPACFPVDADHRGKDCRS